MKKHLFLALLFVGSTAFADIETQRKYLSGKGRTDTVEWEFFCTKGRKSGSWTKIPVPSQWEQHGFGEYNYGHDRKKSNEVGQYKHKFTIPKGWAGKCIKLVFDGVMTDAEVKVNGKAAGPVHQGGFYRFIFDITKLLKSGENLLEVNVSKVSANPKVEAAERGADYWVFGGIYRPVFLEAVPQEHIDWTSVDAKADGSFELDVYVKGITTADKVTGQILDADGKKVGDAFVAAVKKDAEKVRISTTVKAPDLWTAETPNLYKVRISLSKGDSEIHSVTKRFGFRTFEVRKGKGLFLNGSRIWLKGVNRHCFRPESGRCLSRKDSYEDARLIKEMNMNAVRCSHYPPDVHFLEACDELGLYVLDELCTWHKPCLDTPTAERIVGELVRRDQMHPSILFWNNGNENGWNTEADDDFAKYDLQNRTVLHPWHDFNGVDTDHYETYKSVEKKLIKEKKLFMPTEILHGLYDGGHGSGLDDFWNLIGSDKYAGGGMFVWVLADEGIMRTDKDGKVDTFGNCAPDGIVGPHHEKEGSFFTAKEIFSPVGVLNEKIADDFDGTIAVENLYSFRNLKTCSFKWAIKSFADGKETVLKEGDVAGPDIAPRAKGEVKLNLPSDWKAGDALCLTAIDAEKQKLFTWSWSLRKPAEISKRMLDKRKKSKLVVEKNDKEIVVTAGDFSVQINTKTGLLQGIKHSSKGFPLKDGPKILHKGKKTDGTPKITVKESQEVVEIVVETPGGGLDSLVWQVYAGGYAQMKCSYTCDGSYPADGVTFGYRERSIKSKTWLGDGPYRVWKNRMKGPILGVWNVAYNDTNPPLVYAYPEFKGYFSSLNWLKLNTGQGVLGFTTDQEGLFLRIHESKYGSHPRMAVPSQRFGDGISFVHSIPAMGTKFHRATSFGPQSQNTVVKGKREISITIFTEADAK